MAGGLGECSVSCPPPTLRAALIYKWQRLCQSQILHRRPSEYQIHFLKPSRLAAAQATSLRPAEKVIDTQHERLAAVLVPWAVALLAFCFCCWRLRRKAASSETRTGALPAEVVCHQQYVKDQAASTPGTPDGVADHISVEGKDANVAFEVGGFDHAMVVLPEVATTVTGPNMQSGQVCSTLSPETVIHLANSFHLADLRLTEPAIAHEIESISEDIEWLQCFWVACDRNQAATTAMIRSYASWRQDFKLDETRIAAILRAQLIEILPGGGSGSAVTAVVRDIQTIGRLLEAYSFQDVIAAHLVQLKRLLKSSSRAREHGISMVHDLSGLNMALVGSMIDPRNLHAQLQATRFLFTAFPVRFQTIVVVDAPPAFGLVLNAVKAIAPGAIPEPLHFVSRPDAASYCERVFGQPVL